MSALGTQKTKTKKKDDPTSEATGLPAGAAPAAPNVKDAIDAATKALEAEQQRVKWRGPCGCW